MSDYAELVKRLREQAECDKKLYLQGVPFETLLLGLAADAIEELISKLNHADEQIVSLVEAAKSRRWISVDERLPGREWVLCKCPAKFYEVLSLRDGYWYHDPQHMYMGGFVTHWMPLPPKEET